MMKLFIAFGITILFLACEIHPPSTPMARTPIAVSAISMPMITTPTPIPVTPIPISEPPIEISYDELYANNEKYVGKLVKLMGAVRQVSFVQKLVSNEEGSILYITILNFEENHTSDDVIAIYEDTSLRERDFIEFTATMLAMMDIEMKDGRVVRLPALRITEHKLIRD